MTNLIDLLKEAENANQKGFNNGKWLPHKSVEGGNDTIAYGHKLDDKEQAGNFIRMPDGTRKFLKDGGLTEEEALVLLQGDIAEHRAIAEVEWDSANPDNPFSSLQPRDQDILTELTFNIGTLNNKKGKFGWPELAKGIESGDVDKIKKEVSRTFDGKKLLKRTALVRNFIDNPEPILAPLVDIEGEVRASIQQQLAAEKASQTASQEISEPVVDTQGYNEEEERVIQDMMNELQGLPKSTDPVEPSYTEEEEKIIEQLMLDIKQNGLADQSNQPNDEDMLRKQQETEALDRNFGDGAADLLLRT